MIGDRELPTDLICRVRADFGNDADTALDSLRAHLATEPTSDRVLRCVVFIAAGSLDKLAEALRLALIDFRDVIVAGEYDTAYRQLRDMNQPFEVEPPSDSKRL